MGLRTGDLGSGTVAPSAQTSGRLTYVGSAGDEVVAPDVIPGAGLWEVEVVSWASIVADSGLIELKKNGVRILQLLGSSVNAVQQTIIVQATALDVFSVTVPAGATAATIFVASAVFARLA